jgi:archaellum component FlaC
MEEQTQNQVIAASDLRVYMMAMQTDINRIRDFANQLSEQVGKVIENIDSLSKETVTNG